MTAIANYPLLNRIHTPEQIRFLSEAELNILAEELRSFLLHSVSQSGGHFAAGLGVIDLTIALHYVFNTPEDRLVWDVGHQAYPHKILTGRKDLLTTIRQLNGLAPFPSRAESPYDTFGVGHSSTSIGAALGMAIAAEQSSSNRKAVAIIGDGGMTAGMAYEALDHAGACGSDLLVILNDNEMSISPNVGALSSYLTRLMTGSFYATVREGSKKVLERMPQPMWELVRRTEEHVKGMVVPGTLFEEMGFNYFGPIDGHDLPVLVSTLRNLYKLGGPRLLHVVTRKGKGYSLAEKNPVTYHAVVPFDPKVGMEKPKSVAKTKPTLTYTQVFGQWLCDMAYLDSRLIGITPAMREGSGLVKFSEQFPKRYFDVGIAEQHSVTLAAGMACDGLKPVVAIYSTFLQRAYDQLIHDVAIQNLPVLFAIDRAGIVGPDGPTHAGSFDLSFLRCIPNMVVMTPADENECRQMLYTGFMLNQPAAVRYPRGKGIGIDVDSEMTQIPLGKSDLKRSGSKVAILSFGAMLAPALEVAEKLNATVLNMRFVKPIDEKAIIEMARTHELLVTIEDNVIAGGAGSAVSECLAKHGILIPILHQGLPDYFQEHGSREEILASCDLDSKGILSAIQSCQNKLNYAKANAQQIVKAIS
ncbi:1-deoxy-D-xylulose-5-phosphate synthase [Candidatus Nitrosacidococcus tergens]|uniref:1-deoxy-D-xylulose-5-phosphate synthase n=1 Tax=Candidatus Nitrosacidococcus tergens TaxID=553981 RepID=A0A7G1Q9N5_9GAMM|nr:1-deoxy-D-xylulose-5-phosphate synthase [Candidatus Nitrosacidococcus tergens]CAB1275446.1 1-deoxyxylulose-5-phosphate synthase, thiamine-requiring, FAD-requiring [Candidatus Nitrosacidococcus tergens]